MRFSRLVAKAQGKYQRTIARSLCRRPFNVPARVPIVSFTFDDFPRSALLTGGSILRSHGVSGTYYASLGLIGKQIETGNMLTTDDLRSVIQDGHELGCHTFEHCDAWKTEPRKFEKSIQENQRALGELAPGAQFKSMSYPIGVPRGETKRISARYFACCRGGGQAFNIGIVDLNYLSAYFLEQSRDDPDEIKRIIDENARAKGWLIFATHDIADRPTRWGCSPRLFESMVKHSKRSGAQILPVFQAYQSLLN
jgi:peptidoglycan/xylan/chitin deacetylase (PgdA/CDA1 family)